MKRFAVAVALFTLVSLNLASASQPQTSEETAIRATVTDYIEGYYTGDAARMERSLHPHYLKHTIGTEEGQLRMTEHTGLEMIEAVRAGAPNLPASERKEEIAVLDVSGDVASAKLVTSHWVDYLTLAKWNGQWKIVSVVLRENE